MEVKVIEDLDNDKLTPGTIWQDQNAELYLLMTDSEDEADIKYKCISLNDGGQTYFGRWTGSIETAVKGLKFFHGTIEISSA